MQKFNIAKVIGHRGCGYGPENTLTAIRQAKHLGVSWVEFDVQLSRDGVALIMHDETLERTSNAEGIFAEKTYAELKTLDAGSWFSPAFVGEQIPSFEEMLQTCLELNLNINVEIKPAKGFEVETAKETMRVLQTLWPTSAPLLLISSFEHICLSVAREIDAAVPIGVLLDQWQADWPEIAARLNAVSINTNYRILTANHVKKIHDLGYQCCAYTVDEPSQAEKLYAMGVDSLFSNYPDKLLKLIYG